MIVMNNTTRIVKGNGKELHMDQQWTHQGKNITTLIILIVGRFNKLPVPIGVCGMIPPGVIPPVSCVQGACQNISEMKKNKEAINQ